jgi:hypothetical protein
VADPELGEALVGEHRGLLVGDADRDRGLRGGRRGEGREHERGEHQQAAHGD